MSTPAPIPNGQRLARPLVLIGLMGAGKSSVGLRLAARLGVDFLDSDHAVETAAGMNIAAIFETYGEAAFRDVERKVIARLLDERPVVLATGGGAWLNAETRTTIGERACSVWLRAELDVLVARTAGRSHRPLLNQGDPRTTLARLIEERYPVYQLADVAVDSLADQTHEAMAERIVEQVRARPGVMQEVGDG
ncbi:MAG: shikimate kinase [Pseudomonadota bacterium]